jgi:hypothetical protein
MWNSILAILIAFPVNGTDTIKETKAERQSRLETLAWAMDKAALVASCQGQPSDCTPILHDYYTAAAVQIVQADNETRLRRDVQIGRCRPWECDKGKARGLYQLHRNGKTEKEWMSWASLDGKELADAGYELLRRFSRTAGNGLYPNIACAFATLAESSDCVTYGNARAREVAKVSAKLRVLDSQQ